jgi:hypothetical protein
MTMLVTDPVVYMVTEEYRDEFEPPEAYRAEIIRGELVLSPAPSLPHARAQKRLLVLLDAAVPTAIRYELHDGVLLEVDRAEGDKRLTADRPFPYELVPADLVEP